MPDSVLHRAHDAAAVHVFQPLYQLSQLARPAFREGASVYAAGLRFRRDADGWSADRRRAWTLEQLRSVVRRAADTVPYYRELFRREGFDARAPFGFADFARLPTLEREAMRDAGDDLLSEAVPRASLRRDATGGSTGTPTVLWKGPEELGWGRSGVEHYMRRIGLPVGSRIAYLWGHHLDPVVRASRKEKLQDWINNNRWYDCFRLSADVLLDYHRDLQRWRPRAMVCYAGALAALADAVATSGDAPSYPLRAFITGAEKLYDHQRLQVQAVFGVPALERYGSRDVGLIGFQLPPEDWTPAGPAPDFEIDWAAVLVEPEHDGPEAPILVTKLRADGMPMLRYRIGDVARFPEGSAPGHPALRLHAVMGREVDRIWLPDGRWFNALSFPHMLKDFPVREFQVYQAPDHSIELRLVPTEAFDAAAESAIIRTVRPNVGELPIRVRLVDAIPRTTANKWRPVLSDAAPARSGTEATRR